LRFASTRAGARRARLPVSVQWRSAPTWLSIRSCSNDSDCHTFARPHASSSWQRVVGEEAQDRVQLRQRAAVVEFERRHGAGRARMPECPRRPSPVKKPTYRARCRRGSWSSSGRTFRASCDGRQSRELGTMV